MIENIFLGIQAIITTPFNFLAILFGVVSGVLIGALPGLTSTMGVSIMLPFTFMLEPIPGIALLVALYCGSQYGGSIPGILLNTPGTSEAAVTAIDGYKLAQKGMAGQALGTSVIASACGGLLGVILLIIFAPAVAKIAISFAAPEYFCLALFGMSMVVNIEAGSELKNIIGGITGLFLATVGIDSLTGFPRFTFGSVSLTGGISFIPVMIGIFAAAEVFRQAESWCRREFMFDANISNLPAFKDIWRLKWSMLRSIGIGTLIGALPAAGSTLATFIAYNEAKRWSKQKEKFGTGILEGVAAPESANNAGAAGAMLPTMTVGIPGSAVTAVILGGLMIHGIRPGPLLFVNQADFVYAIFMGMVLSNFLFLILGLFGVKVFANVLRVPSYILNAVIIVLCVVGSFVLRNNIADVWIMLISGIIGYFIKKSGFSPLPIIIGMVLGKTFEVSFRQTMVLFDNDLTVFLKRPYAATFLAFTLVSAFWTQIISFLKRFREKRTS
ncbi:MAG: tripartite tricarboxylate transporter permease [Deltaproteobacteria bacterium]|nr:tripartite tricarboxylate transporter permease [Deltaproteobacteria bacterium]MBW2154499.1 tripartite tricarboxylate transporter permease [Deltaproteobacteria bacterium]